MIQRFLTINWENVRVATNFISKEQKLLRFRSCSMNSDEDFLYKIICGDERSICGYDSETKYQSSQ